MNQAFICDGVRTPIGRYGGALANVRADDLAALPLRALLERHPNVDWSRVDDVILGCANQAGKTTAIWPVWRRCWPDCHKTFPAPPSTGYAVRGWMRWRWRPAASRPEKPAWFLPEEPNP